VVTTSRGYTRDYSGDDVVYCAPDDVNGIRRAVQEAFEAPVPDRLRQRILTEFTWDAAANATFGAYRAVVGASS
jgi:glycosyltransferase involved in cell wall biosynthesis